MSNMQKYKKNIHEIDEINGTCKMFIAKKFNIFRFELIYFMESDDIKV